MPERLQKVHSYYHDDRSDYEDQSEVRFKWGFFSRGSTACGDIDGVEVLLLLLRGREEKRTLPLLCSRHHQSSKPHLTLDID